MNKWYNNIDCLGRLQVVEKDLKMISDARKEVESQATRMLEQGMDSQVCCGRFFSLLLRNERSSSSYFLHTKNRDSLDCVRLQLDHNAPSACNHNALRHFTSL